jgi:hypothetical protein
MRQVMQIWRLAALGLLCAAAAQAATPGQPIPLPALAIEAARFEEPLVPTVPTSAAEDADLLAAIRQYHAAPAVDDLSALEGFVAGHPQSGWRLAVLTNLGLANFHYGYISRAIDAFDRAWREGQPATEPRAKALADRAVGELLRLHAGLAHVDAVAALLAQTEGRGLSGRASEWRDGAKEELSQLRHDLGIPCGLTSLRNLLLARGAPPAQMARIETYRLGPGGMPLSEVGRLATTAGLPHRLILRRPGEPVPVPSVMHWQVRHFSAIVGARNGRYELADPTFGTAHLWLTQAAIDAEGSGYFLVPDAQPTAAWRDVSLEEAAQVRGR